MYLQNVISFWFLMYVVHTSPSTSSQEALDSATWEVPSNCSCALNVIFLRHFNEILYSCTCVTYPCLCMHFKLCYTWENSLVSQSCYRNMFKTFNWWSSNRCCHNSKLHMCNIYTRVCVCMLMKLIHSFLFCSLSRLTPLWILPKTLLYVHSSPPFDSIHV